MAAEPMAQWPLWAWSRGEEDVMESLAFPAVATLIVLLIPGIVGAYIGVGDRSTTRVRALGASALLLLAGGGGIIHLLTDQPAGGSGADALSFLALWLGVVMGALVAAIGCGAGLAHAVTARHWVWLGIQVIGSVLPMALAGAVLTGHVGPHAIGADITPLAPALLEMLFLVALAPLVTLAYGFWAARQRWLRTQMALF